MFLASAYPNSAISAGAMMAIAVVVVGTLVFWIGMVYLADRQPRQPGTRRARGYPTVVATPGKTAEDERSEPDHQPHGAAA